MATEKKFRYQHILSNVEDKAPTSAQILDGEIAVNTFTGSEKMFIKNASGNIVSFSSDNAIGEIIIDNTSGKVDTTTFETYSGNVDTAINSKLATSDFNTYSGAVDTEISSKAAQSDLNTLSDTVTGHTADTDIHVTTTDKATWNTVTSKTDNSEFTAHTASSVHMTSTEKENLDSLASNIAAISGVTSTKVSNWDGAVTNLGGFKLVEITQSDYDNLPTPRDSKTLYIIRN